MPYKMPISDPQAVANLLWNRVAQTKEDRASHMNTLTKLRARVDGQVPPRPYLFEGQSNFQPPISATFVLLFLARAAKALLSAPPTDYLVAENAYGQKLRDRITPYLKQRFEGGKWAEHAEQWMHQAAVDGAAVLWEHWDKRPNPRIEVVEVADARIGTTEDDVERGTLLGALIQQHFEWTPTTTTVVGDWKAKVVCENGVGLRIGTVELVDVVGNSGTLEWDFDEYVEGVKLEVMDPEKVGWSPHTKDPETEGLIWRTFPLSWARLRKLAEEGAIVLPSQERASATLAKVEESQIVPEEEVEGAGPAMVLSDLSPGGEEAQISEERYLANQVVELYASTPTDSLEITEVIIPWAYREGNEADRADCIFWILNKTRSLIAAEPLYRRYRHGMRPLAIMWYSRFEGRAVPRGIPWYLETIEDEIYTMHNLTADSAVWAMSVFGFFRPTSPNNYQMALDVQPYKFYPLNNPNEDVKIVTINPNFQVGLQMTMFLMQLARDLIGVSEQSYGRPPKRARGVYDTLALMNESNVRFEYVITQWGRAMSRALTLWWKMEKQFAPASETIRMPGVGGEDKFERAPSRVDLSKSEFSVRFEVNTSMMNSAVMRQALQFVLATVTNPLALQTGITDLGGWYNALEDTYRAMGVPAPQRYISRPPQALAKRRLPEEEWEAFLEHEEIRIHSLDDDEGHLADHISKIASPEDEALYSPQQIAKWVAHIKAHEQQLQAKRTAALMRTMQEAGTKPQNTGITPPPPGSGAKTAAEMGEQPAQSTSAAGGVSPATEPTQSLEPEQVTTASKAQETL